MSVAVGDVVQTDGTNARFAFCFATVTEVRPWGVIGIVRVPDAPTAGDAYVRIPREQFVRVGPAEWAPAAKS